MTCALPLSQSGTKATDIAGSQTGTGSQGPRTSAQLDHRSSLLGGGNGRNVACDWARRSDAQRPSRTLPLGLPSNRRVLCVCAVWRATVALGAVHGACRSTVPGSHENRGWNQHVWSQVHSFRHHSLCLQVCVWSVNPGHCLLLSQTLQGPRKDWCALHPLLREKLT